MLHLEGLRAYRARQRAALHVATRRMLYILACIVVTGWYFYV